MWYKLKQILGILPSETQKYADFYQSYLKIYSKPDAKKSICQQSFVVLDTETTGLDLQQDNILSIGAVRIHNNVIDIADSLSLIVKNKQVQTQDAVAIHGLVQTDIKGQSESEAIETLFRFIGSDLIVGHHIAFDIAMLNKLSRKCGGGEIRNQILDTSYLARRLDHPSDPNSLNRKDYTLDKLCSRFQVIPKARHTADGDAFITAIVFMKLLQKLYSKGVISLGHLVR